MTKDELQRVRDWADAKIATGAEPPWSWFQYMKLRETLDAILEGMACRAPTDLPADSPEAASHRGSGHLRLVDTGRQESAPPHPTTVRVPLPM